MSSRLPINDTIVAAVAQLIDDSKAGEHREPTHSEIEFYVGKAGLSPHDPKTQGQVVGKAKRVRAVLQGAMLDDEAAGSKLIELLLAKVRACGGFRPASTNYVGREAVENARAAFDSEGFHLAEDGSVAPKVLSALRRHELTDALNAYAVRAQRGSEDAALLTGTSKDLMEATAAHVLETINGSYPSSANFHGLLGMAYMTLGLAVPEVPAQPGEPPHKGLERALFASAIAVNKLRNKEGTGHGRPWLPSLSPEDAKAAVELVGSLSSYLLAKLSKHKRA
jgi:hypothetical protein